MSGFIYHSMPSGGTRVNGSSRGAKHSSYGHKAACEQAPKFRPDEKAVIEECLAKGVLHMSDF